MNILAVCHYGLYQDLSSSFVHNQAKAYAAIGHQVRVIIPIPLGKAFQGSRMKPAILERQCDGVTLYYVRYLSGSKYGKKSFNAMSASRAISGQLGKILKDFRPDVIHAHTLGFDSSIGCWLKKKLNCPLVVTTHGSDTEIPLGRGEHRWLKTMCDQADQIVAVSNRLKQRLLSCDPETPVSTVLNGFIPNIESTCGPKEPLSILQVGHLIPSKRNAVTIQALSRLREIYPQITLTVIGAGVLRQQLEELVKDLGLTDAVTFTGQVPNPKVLEAMARSSYFIMPSKPEGFGIVYLEAMSNGCITVGTEGEGISDLIQSSKNGFLVPADDPEAVAQVVCWCEQHPQEAAAIARRGCDDTRNLTWEHNAERYTQLFCRLTGRL